MRKRFIDAFLDEIDKIAQEAEEEPEEEEEEEEEGQGPSGDVGGRVFAFLAENPNPDDDDFHEWAESEGIDVHEAERAAYEIATAMVQLVTGGKSGGDPPQGVRPDQIEKGVEVEKEHTNNDFLARKIALDHLAEFPDYYDALDEMEKRLKKEKMGEMSEEEASQKQRASEIEAEEE